MAAPKKIYPILTKAGIKRDGTVFDGNFHVDGAWCRWQRGRPRKMLGYRQMSNDFTGYSRGCRIDGKGGTFYVHSGSASYLEQGTFTASGIQSNFYDRTPAGFTADSDNMWQHAVIYDATGTAQVIISHAAPNLQYIDSAVERPVYYGDLYGSAALTAITGVDVSGGVCVLPPYLFAYSSDGLVKWSVENDPTDFSNAGSGEARVTGGKIVFGLPARAGSGNAPAGLFWATDALVRTTFTGGTTIFNFDRITQGYSILSSQGVVEYDGVYFWPGIDRFLYFDGVVRELPNDMNLNFFYDNLNKLQRQKVFGYKVPRYGEIWWCFPKGADAEECNHAVVFNVREKTWYDTPLPDGGRVSGYTDQTFQWPIMFGADLSGGKAQLWQQEYGVDKQIDNTLLAIRSYYETADISFAATGVTGNEIVGDDRNVIIDRVEPDFIMNGTMNLTIVGEPYAQSDTTESDPYPFNSSTEKIDMREQFRQMRMRFESNVQGGNYQAGQILLRLTVGDGRP